MALPLEGIRVADFSWILAGPHLTSWMAVMGAEVIKVESQVYPDIVRTLPSSTADGIPGPNRNGAFHQINCGKKAITINLATPRGKHLAYELIRKSDITLECFHSTLSRKLGLTYDDLRTVRNDVILISLSLLGKYGLEPSSWQGWGPVAGGFSGIFDAQAYPGGPPRQTGGIWPDYAVGSAVLFHALAALHNREMTGQGQWIDVSMCDVVIGEMPEWHIDYFMNGRDRHAWANKDDVMAPHNTYRCSGEDKWIAIAVGTDNEWRALCGAMGNPEWSAAPRFADQFSRWQNRDELDQRIGAWTVNFEHIELANRLQKCGVAAGPVLDSVEIVDDPHLWDWGYWRRMVHPEVGERILPGLPMRMTGIPEYNFGLPPDVGQDNMEVFGQLLGLPEAEIKRLMEEKVIY